LHDASSPVQVKAGSTEVAQQLGGEKSLLEI
jgi:hypothetical protein